MGKSRSELQETKKMLAWFWAGLTAVLLGIFKD
jgi:hypothetical protein